MFYAILISFLSYVYMQWTSFKAFLFVTSTLYCIYIFCLTISNADRSLWDDVVVKMRKQWFIAFFSIFLCFMIPSQKTLGTSIALGATTYMAHEAITSEIGQKFVKLVSHQANTVLDEKLKELSEVQENNKK